MSFNLNSTPSANRTHISIFGKTNAGKSSLLNAIIGQEVSIVSAVEGTTTDPVIKSMELLPFGPVVFIDTAGLGDDSEIGHLRVERTKKILHRTDFALLVTSPEDVESQYNAQMLESFAKYNIPYMTVVNKIDTLDENAVEVLKGNYPNHQYVSAVDDLTVLDLKKELIGKLQKNEKEYPILGDLLPYDSTVVMVVPVDSEAPKGRIILPQVQLIRDCLDHGIKSYVVRDTELAGALKDLDYKVDLVVTDSQAFKEVNEIVPNELLLTSFSILFARYKGDISVFLEGAKKLEGLSENAKILISESCTHNHSHEDIGRYKIPKLMETKLGKKFNFEFKMGHDFPNDDSLDSYDLIIHCGSCMLNQKTMQTRIQLCQEKNIAITNYGVVLAALNGILDRSVEVFFRNFDKEMFA